MKLTSMLGLICCLILVLSSAGAIAAPEVVLDGSPVFISEGVWQYNYILKNYASQQHINDLDVDASMQHGWIEGGGPDGWNFVWLGTMSRWVTESAPVYTDTEKSGFWLRAAVPTFYYGGAQFTYGTNHQVFATGLMAMPVPEPGTIAAVITLLAPVGLAIRRRRA